MSGLEISELFTSKQSQICPYISKVFLLSRLHDDDEANDDYEDNAEDEANAGEQDDDDDNNSSLWWYHLQACAPRYVYYSINKKRREPVTIATQ